MTDDRDSLTPETASAEEAVRSLRPVSARPEFKGRLRAEFAEGRLQPRLALVKREPAGGAWKGAFLIFASAAVAAYIVLQLNAGPDWQVRKVQGSGQIRVDGHRYSAGKPADYAALLRPGSRIQLTGAASLQVAAADNLIMEIAPGSDISLPRAPGRWWDRQGLANIRAGELRITTGRAFPGAGLLVVSPDTHVMVTGTTLAVICDNGGTCVCVCEGQVKVGRELDSMVVVPQGHLRYTPRDGSAAHAADIRPTERVALSDLRDKARRVIGH